MEDNPLKVSLDAFKRDAAAARSEGACVICGEPAAPNIYSEAGRREYEISGSCEICFDKMFAEPEEEVTHYNDLAASEAAIADEAAEERIIAAAESEEDPIDEIRTLGAIDAAADELGQIRRDDAGEFGLEDER